MAAPDTSASGAVWPSPVRGWTVVAILMAAYILALIDRQILSLLVEPIKAEFVVSDTQIGLLQGFAFGLFYTLVGLPLGWAADRGARRTLLAAGVALWSLATAGCALAGTFGHLFLARMGVGIGEAALAPIAVSLIADLFPPDRRAFAMGVYVAAGSIGGGLALVVGGWAIAAVQTMPVLSLGAMSVGGWRLVFPIVGLPGLVVALALMLMREPARLDADRSHEAGGGEPFAVFLRRTWPIVVPQILAFGLFSLEVYGLLAWLPTFMLRAYGTPVTRTGAIFGALFAILGPIGAVTGGYVARRLRRAGRADANLLTASIGIGVSIVPYALGTILPPTAALVAFGIGTFCSAFPSGASVAALQELTPNRLRGRIAALYYFAVNLIGLGLGPVTVPLVAEHLSGGALGPALLAIVLGFGLASAVLILLARRQYQLRGVRHALQM